jgi:hypothetical protein
MATFTIPNRPFATEPFTGLMTPDGIFEAALGEQVINAHVQNTGATVTDVQVYVESVSDPGIVVTPQTQYIASAAGGVSHLFSWQADFTAAQPGKHLVSFIVQTPSGHQRIIKKIFVTKMAYNPATHSFLAATPEGVLAVAFESMIGPANPTCCPGNKRGTCANGVCVARQALANAVTAAAQNQESAGQAGNLLHYLTKEFKRYDPNFVFCMPQVLIDTVDTVVVPTPPFAGQYGDLPFQDPWWKVILAILAFLLLVAAAIAEAVDGTGTITVGASGTHDLPSGTGGSCCTPSASGGGTSTVAAGLTAAAATVATIAAASDVRDPYRKGQDHTAPDTTTELTKAEALKMSLKYSDPIIPGKPFKVGIEYKYVRHTTAKNYTYSATETNENVHLLDHYVIDAPNVVRAYKREPFIVKAQFYEDDKKLYKGDQLFVQCYLIGPSGQFHTFPLQDNGVSPDAKPNDGTYTGMWRFTTEDIGLWKFFVLAQDVNRADPNLDPEQAAQIIAGMILTNQLSITFEGGTCPLVPDGDVNVI